MNSAPPAAFLADLPEAVQLSHQFDAEKLVKDLNRITVNPWREREEDPSLPGGPTEKDWRVLPLRSLDGSVTETTPGKPGLRDFADTPLVEHTPYLKEILSHLPTEIRSARLTRLGPGGFLNEHRDRCGFDYGVLRLHIPITTDPKAALIIDGRTHQWQPGTFWYGDFSRMHSVRNDGTNARVHLVLDALVTSELVNLFPPKFIERLPAEEVIFARPRMRLSVEEANHFRCSFLLPRSFVEFSKSLPQTAATGDKESAALARVDVVESQLVLHLDDRPCFGLVNLGGYYFRLLAGTEERLIQVDTDGPHAAVRLHLRHGKKIHEMVCEAIRLTS